MTRKETFDIINRDYLGENSFSFGGKYRLYDELKGKYSKKDINEALKYNSLYTRFLKYNKPKIYSPIYVWEKDELWEMDTAVFNNEVYINKNDGFKYLLVIIDVFTKWVSCIPLKTSTTKNTIKCLEKVFQETKRKPQKIYTDR